MKPLSTFLLWAFLPLAPVPVFGQLVAFGQSTGVVSTFSAAINGQDLVVTVDNTMTGVGGVTGTVTSFGFNTAWAAPLVLDDISLSYQVLQSPGSGPTSGWNKLSSYELDAGGLQAMLDLGAESDANNNPNGGNPGNAVKFGDIVAFKFTFAGPYEIPDLDDIAEFFNQDPTGFDFAVRWQEVANSTAGNSDAYAGDWPGGYDIPQGGGVPEPSTYGLIAVIAILALIGNRIPRRRSAD